MVDNAGLERLEFNYFRVVITGIANGAAPANGGVDPKTPEEYGADSALPSTTALALEKERANMRWEEVLRQTSFEIQPVFLADVTTNADEDNPGTNVSFTLVYDKKEYLRTEDELTPGTFLNGDPLRETVSGNATDVIQRYVARALNADIIQNREIFDPDSLDNGNTDQYVEVTADAPEASIAAAEAKITVTEIANTSPTFPTFG